MRGIVLTFAIAAILLLAFGCAGPQISSKEETKKTVTPPPVAEEEKEAR
jgi:hypothetical protein